MERKNYYYTLKEDFLKNELKENGGIYKYFYGLLNKKNMNLIKIKKMKKEGILKNLEENKITEKDASLMLTIKRIYDEFPKEINENFSPEILSEVILKLLKNKKIELPKKIIELNITKEDKEVYGNIVEKNEYFDPNNGSWDITGKDENDKDKLIEENNLKILRLNKLKKNIEIKKNVDNLKNDEIKTLNLKLKKISEEKELLNKEIEKLKRKETKNLITVKSEEPLYRRRISISPENEIYIYDDDVHIIALKKSENLYSNIYFVNTIYENKEFEKKYLGKVKRDIYVRNETNFKYNVNHINFGFKEGFKKVEIKKSYYEYLGFLLGSYSNNNRFQTLFTRYYVTNKDLRKDSEYIEYFKRGVEKALPLKNVLDKNMELLKKYNNFGITKEKLTFSLTILIFKLLDLIQKNENIYGEYTIGYYDYDLKINKKTYRVFKEEDKSKIEIIEKSQNSKLEEIYYDDSMFRNLEILKIKNNKNYNLIRIEIYNKYYEIQKLLNKIRVNVKYINPVVVLTYYYLRKIEEIYGTTIINKWIRVIFLGKRIGVRLLNNKEIMKIQTKNEVKCNELNIIFSVDTSVSEEKIEFKKEENKIVIKNKEEEFSKIILETMKYSEGAFKIEYDIEKDGAY